MVIGIIGGGLSGTLTAIHLLQNAPGGTTICLVEQDRYRMHRGIAYASQLPFQPLNVPAASMSLFPDKPDDFYTWLAEHQHKYSRHLSLPVRETDFIPRHIFGDYLKARLLEAEARKDKGVTFSRAYDEAIAVKREEAAFRIELGSGEAIQADKVVLAFGNFPPASLPIPHPEFYQSDLYVASPWSAKALANLPAEAPVLLIGSSLTMVDLVGSLQAQGHKGTIYVVSRHGLLPQPCDVGTAPYPLKISLPLRAGLSALETFRFIRREITRAEANGYTWRDVLDALRANIPVIWQAFSLQEKKAFLRHLRPYWETHRHRIPASSAALLQQLQAEGQLEVIAASIVDIQQLGEGACVTLRRRKHAHQEQLTVARVINCTGPQSDFAKIQAPLVRQLLADGLVVPDELKLGLVTTPGGALLGKAGKPIAGLYTLGPSRKGMLYESTALREIRQQAHDLAQELTRSNSAWVKAQQAI